VRVEKTEDDSWGWVRQRFGSTAAQQVADLLYLAIQLVEQGYGAELPVEIDQASGNCSPGSRIFSTTT